MEAKEVLDTIHPEQMHKKHYGEGVPFERTRRITGYLVGSMDRWGNAKKAEFKDRVKHCCREDV